MSDAADGPVSLLDESRLPLPFCPGCGHSHVLPALAESLAELDTDPAGIVLVTDIGCVGLADQYVATSAFHGLHGRSFTYAAGLKLARPELRVVVLVGDGGCGIGGNHLIHAARRNVGITVLVFNNFNFGMTGGQHSATTPTGGLTATTRDGHLETPLDICATVAPGRPAFVARTSTFDPSMGELMLEALRTDGFALLDIWELCTAYYGPRNRLNRKAMTGLSEEFGMPMGVITRNHRPEYAAALRERLGEPTTEPVPAAAPIEAQFDSGLNRRVSVLLAGGAGQRVQSSAAVLGRAALAARLHATQKSTYPVTVRTGFSIAELLLDPEPIEHTSAEVPDYAVVSDPDGVSRVAKRLAAMGADDLIVADADLELPDTGAEILRLPLVAESRGTGSPALLGLAALLSRTDLVPREAVEWAIRDHYGERGADLLELLGTGYADPDH